jgi:hypothetical protein
MCCECPATVLPRTSSCRGPELRTQNAALIANAYARMGRNDTGLLRHLAFELTSVPVAAFVGPPGARDLSNLLNSFARLGFRDVAMLVHLTAAARRLSETRCTFGAQAIANIMNAVVRLDFVHEELILDMAEAALRVPPGAFDTQAISVMLNALSKAGKAPPAVLAHLHQGMGAMKAQDWTAQAVGISVNALANLRYPQGSAFGLMRDAALTLDKTRDTALDPQALANIVNAFARPHVMELVDTLPLFRHMAAQALEMPPDAFSAQAAALTARAFAKPEASRAVGAEAELVIDKMAGLAQTFPASHFSPQAAAMMMLSVAEVPVPSSLSTARYLMQVLRGMTHFELGPATVRSLAMVCSAAEALDVYDEELLEHLALCIQVPCAEV